MRKLKRVALLVLALVLALAPMSLAAETVLTNTAWQINATVGSAKGTTVLRFYDNTMRLRLGDVQGSYTFDDKTGKLVMTIKEAQASVVVESITKPNKKGTSVTLSDFMVKDIFSNTTPKGILGTVLPFSVKMTKLAPKVSKVSAKVVTLGTPSVVSVKANAAAECFVVYDKDGKEISKGLISNGAGSVEIAFAAKKNPITVRVGLLDASGKLIESSLSKAIKATIKCK